MRIFQFILCGIVLAGCARVTGGSSPLPGVAFARQPATHAGYKSLYSFKGGSDGAAPVARLLAVNGALYGTTSFGGKGGWGTVFEVSASGQERVLFGFTGGTDGAMPSAGLIAVNGVLYGTTQRGGGSGCEYGAGCGTVFAVNLTSGAEQFSYSFKGGADGEHPQAGLVTVNGKLYGTTSFGGARGLGTVFEVSTLGRERVIYSFKGGTDGSEPVADLVAVNGVLYGTTCDGDARHTGTFFEVSTSGKERVLYRFGSRRGDGILPVAGPIAVNGELYGTTLGGGGSAGFGTVFVMTTVGKERVRYSFEGAADGAYPRAALIAANGALYGTATQGGGSGCFVNTGCGTVFEVTHSGEERILYRFIGGADGANPQASLVAMNGKLYGTTESGGGSSGGGTVFEVTP